MEVLPHSPPMVSLAVVAAALYSRAASSRLRPGFPRLAALLPVVVLFAAAPLAFTFSYSVRGTAGFFLGWLGVFKLLLLAAGRSPLEPTLPVLPFVFIAVLPVKIRRRDNDGSPGEAGSPASKAKSVPLISSAVKLAVVAALLRVYQFKDQLHLYTRLALYGVHLYCVLDVLLLGAAAAAGALGMETEPMFDQPYLASSLRDFWGRRWNLTVSAILRPSVYDPVRARAGKAGGVLCVFLVSGLMHEAMVGYITMQRPTGEMLAFFLLHGAACVVEELCARRWWAARGWPAPPRAVATLLVMVFVSGTAFWLFFPPLCGDGRDDKLLEEWAAAAAFLVSAGRKLLLGSV